MLAVGIDISKSKSVAAILNQDGSMHTSPFEFHHTQPELNAFIKYILNSNQSATILMENTGHYHYPVLKAFREAGLPVCMVNAYQIKKFGDMDLRKAKTDKKDAVRIARYALEKSYSLVPYTSMEQKYEDLRFLARQYNQRMLTLKTNKVFLLNLLDETMPGITNILPLTSRTPETSLSVLFINRFKSYDRIKKMGKNRFLDAFEKIARKSRNRQTKTYGLAIYEAALRNITTRGENEYTLAAQDQCLELVCESQKAADSIILKMQTLAETLPEYAVLRSMAGVGDRLGPLILAEIGDIRRFHSGKALNAYAGNDAPPYQSGTFESHNRHISKRGNAALRKYCFEVMQALKLTQPQDDPVYLFLLKKEQEGKPYNVAKMAGVNKFLRIYYARAMETLKQQ